MIDLTGLNPQQKEAVENIFGPLMILAGAGTGKTKVITARIAFMLNKGIAPQKIVAMTFTNKAAKEMRDRIKQMVGDQLARKLTISTFHSFCLQILRQYPKEAQIKPGFCLLATADQLDLVRRALDEKGWSGLYKPDYIHAQISMCKNWLISPHELEQRSVAVDFLSDPAIIAPIYGLYERLLEMHRAIDFDDCIYKVVKVLRHSESLRQKLRDRYQFVMVDEFQDTNAAQFAVLEELVSEKGNICVVGDDDQSIYSWRGAMYETLEKFEKKFQHPKLIKLEQNYRCTNIILNAANQVIRHNLKRKDKTLWSASESSDPIILAGLDDASAEARFVAHKIIAILGQGFLPKDIVVLYRANSQAKLIEMALKECHILYKTFGGQSFFERKEIKDFLSYLRLIVNPDDHLAFWRVINTPPRGIGLKSQENIEKLARQANLSPYMTLKEQIMCGEENLRHQKEITEFIQQIEDLRKLELSHPESIEQLGMGILEQFKLIDHVKMQSKNQMSRFQKVESLKNLPAWLKKIAEDKQKNESHYDPYQLLDAITLSDQNHTPKEETSGNFVSLMTMHAAKGLEFPIVFVVGLEEGSLPHKNSLGHESDICEERRLFYVALTRAKKKLFLSYAKLRQTGFTQEKRQKSRFILELPTSIIDPLDIAQSEEKPETRKTQTLNKLAKLKMDLLDSK